MDLTTAPRSNRVTALFQDATLLAFDLDPDTSLGELAVHIGEAAGPHGALFLPIYVRIAPAAARQHEKPYRESWRRAVNY
jgi:hypothetical protein